MSDGIGGTDQAHPTTLSELQSMITAQWPKVLESNMAIEKVRLDKLELVSDGEEDDSVGDYEYLWVQHRVVRSCGPEIEGTACHDPQIFFTEEQAVRAAWYQYNALTPIRCFETDSFGVLLIWRNQPELDVRHGTFSARLRYSVIYKTRHGQFTSAQRLSGEHAQR